jgi:hypothetical protein
VIKDLLVAATEDRPTDIDLLAKVGRGRPRPLIPVLAAVCTAAAASAGLFFLSPRHDASSVAVTHVGQGYRLRVFQDGTLAQEGVFDPVRHLGVIKGHQNYESEDRIIGDVEYYKGDAMPPGRLWDKVTGHTQVSGPVDASGLVYFGGQDPQWVLRYLRSNTVFHRHGTHATFSSKRAPAGSPQFDRFTGAIDLDAQGRLRSLSVTGYPPDATKPRPPSHFLLEISDYGIAVRVTPPPASQVMTKAERERWLIPSGARLATPLPAPPSQTPR